MSNRRSDSITVTTSTTTLIGFKTGKITLRNVCHSPAPSTFAASRRDGSTLLSPAR
jgi:hypothetical protein